MSPKRTASVKRPFRSGKGSELQPYEVRPGCHYSLTAVAEIVRVPRRRIAIYCRHGLIAPAAHAPAAEWRFDDEAIRLLRRIEHLRETLGMNLRAIKVVLGLVEEVEHLRREVRFWRGM